MSKIFHLIMIQFWSCLQKQNNFSIGQHAYLIFCRVPKLKKVETAVSKQLEEIQGNIWGKYSFLTNWDLRTRRSFLLIAICIIIQSAQVRCLENLKFFITTGASKMYQGMGCPTLSMLVVYFVVQTLKFQEKDY